MAGLLKRVERLERQNRWLKRVVVAMIATVGVCALMAADAQKAKTLDAEKFVLRDEDGSSRAVLEIGKSGPRLSLLSKDGNDQAVLGLGDDGNPSLVLVGAKRNKFIVLGTAKEEQSLVFNDRDSSRLVLGTDEDGDALLVFRDGREKSRTLLSGFGADPGLTVYDHDGQERVRLILDKGEERLELRDKSGKVTFSQPAAGDTGGSPTSAPGR